MEEEDFKGFEDLKFMKGGGMTFWAFKGEDTWSRDIVELWKWVELAREKERSKGIMKTIKQLEKDIEVMDKYHTREDRKIYKSLSVQLQTLKDVLKLIDKIKMREIIIGPLQGKEVIDVEELKQKIKGGKA